MRLFTSHFKAWIIAALCVLGIESAYYWLVHPIPAARTNFIARGLENNYQPDTNERIIETKLEMQTSPPPTILQVGDSSGFFGIIPDVIERYVPGQKFLNSSCCAIQGYNGYLALIRFQLDRFPSLKYVIVHAGVVSVAPSAIQWRDAPKEIAFRSGGVLKTVGAKMERDFEPPWKYLNLPTNALRPFVLNSTFLGTALTEQLEQDRVSGLLEAVIDGARARQGYGIEADVQTISPDARPLSCRGFQLESFFDWHRMRSVSYLEAFVEEFVALAREYDVVPILVFPVTACTEATAPGAEAFRAELRRLQAVYPDLRVPLDPVESFPANDFSVSVHVQRGVAEEQSRRLGRALRQIVMPGKTLPTEPPPSNETLNILHATRGLSCGDEVQDLTRVFGDSCDGHESCSVPLAGFKPARLPRGCRTAYLLEFNCDGGPTRLIRQETETAFGGTFALDCAEHDRWPRDPTPYGILVADASYANGPGGPLGLGTIRVMAFCDGRMRCDYAIPDFSTASTAAKPEPAAVRWYCGGQEHRVTADAARPGDVLPITCETSSQ